MTHRKIQIWTIILILATPIGLYEAMAHQEKPILTTKSSPWQSLVRPDAHWSLHEIPGSRKILIEAYDIQKLGTATLARLRWLRVDSEQKRQSAVEPGQEGLLIQRVAVTPRGLYLLSPDHGIDEIAKTLKREPDQPSRLTSKKKISQGSVSFRVAKSETEGCFGFYFTTECDTDNCYATICVDSEKGITFVSGGYSPDSVDYSL